MPPLEHVHQVHSIFDDHDQVHSIHPYLVQSLIESKAKELEQDLIRMVRERVGPVASFKQVVVVVIKVD